MMIDSEELKLRFDLLADIGSHMAMEKEEAKDNNAFYFYRGLFRAFTKAYEIVESIEKEQQEELQQCNSK